MSLATALEGAVAAVRRARHAGRSARVGQSMAPGFATPEEPDMPALDLAGSDAAEQFARLAMDLHDSDGVEETVQAVVEFALGIGEDRNRIER